MESDCKSGENFYNGSMKVLELNHVGIHIRELRDHVTLGRLASGAVAATCFDFPGAWFRLGDFRNCISSVGELIPFNLTIVALISCCAWIDGRLGKTSAENESRFSSAQTVPGWRMASFFLCDPDGHTIELFTDQTKLFRDQTFGEGGFEKCLVFLKQLFHFGGLLPGRACSPSVH